MSCFSCFSSNERKRKALKKEMLPLTASKEAYKFLTDEGHPRRRYLKENANRNNTAKSFRFRELATATRNFHPDSLLGEGGFGRVYKGRINATGQDVAVKQLDRDSTQGDQEFLVEVLMLSLLSHPNLVPLVGYCSEGNQRLLVYEYMPQGSLDDHLLDIPAGQAPLSWHQRMKIALDSAVGLEYLHEKAYPPVIYRDLKCSNILLDENYNARLSDFGLAKIGRMGDDFIPSARVMGTYGYCAPEYIRTRKLNAKSDVYSFGVLMLELLTGRRAYDNTRPSDEQILANWAHTMFKDQRKYKYLVDPHVRGRYPEKGLNQAVAIAIMCLQDEPTSRPLMTDVVMALSHLTSPPDGATSSQQEKPLVLDERKIEAAAQIAKNDRGKNVVEASESGSNSRSERDSDSS